MRTLIIISFIIIHLSGCDSANVQPKPEPSPDEKISILLQKGEFNLVATEYLKLSDIYPELSGIYNLKAANAFIQDMNLDSANVVLEANLLSQSQEDITFYTYILIAKIALLQSQPDHALKLTDRKIPEIVNPDYLIEMHKIRADAFTELNSLIKSAEELVKLDALLISTNQQPVNSNMIWNHLVNSDINKIGQSTNIGEDNFTSWVELAIISKSLITRNNELKTAITTWMENNPLHPANGNITSEILLISEKFDSKPTKIALLLPLSGVYKRYSEKIRDGFLSAWYLEENYKPEIKIYNTNLENFTDIYLQAIADGADFIVGPLEKESVRSLTEMEKIPVRTLALNQVDINRPDNSKKSVLSIPDLVQFGLPPEDEAKQVAQRGIYEGYNRALIITSDDEYGRRVFNAFNDEWSAMGGTLLERVDYDPQTSDFVTPIKQILNINTSEARFTALRQKLGRNLSSSSRLREDLEFVFMVATNLNARQIVPHLRFFKAEGIPIYTISSVYTGKHNFPVDNDLNGVEFVDIPWLLNPEKQNQNIAKLIQQSWPSMSTVFPRYYAFGIDAFHLISQIGDLSLNQTYRYQGEAGNLYMTNDGVIHRNLLWAKFDNGIPILVNTERSP
ncbi:MAG: outer membrane PBP1 activator LpoA protein [Gammaproteobacteria bacterium]|jgi:outer membrane PBP1 activator LpoA protein